MWRKSLSLLFVALLLHAVSFVAPLSASAWTDSEALFAARVKAEIAKLGAGPAARVKVKLRDKTKLEGYVTEVGEDHFVVADKKTGAPARVEYAEVVQVKSRGNNLSSGAKVGIWVAIAAAVAIIIAVVGRGGDRNDSPCARRDITTPCPPGCVCAQ